MLFDSSFFLCFNLSLILRFSAVRISNFNGKNKHMKTRTVFVLLLFKLDGWDLIEIQEQELVAP